MAPAACELRYEAADHASHTGSHSGPGSTLMSSLALTLIPGIGVVGCPDAHDHSAHTTDAEHENEAPNHALLEENVQVCHLPTVC